LASNNNESRKLKNLEQISLVWRLKCYCSRGKTQVGFKIIWKKI
jgi:hypothetical protein